MRYRALGNSGIEASVVGLGTWVTGGGEWWGPWPEDDESIRAIHAALNAGVNLIDTAPCYGYGHSEEIVGRAIRDRRDQAVVATKCGLWWHDDRGSAFYERDGRTVRRCVRPETMRVEIEDSLRRLGTDRIDLYQTHWPSTEPDKTPICDTMACLMEMKAAGKIRAIGVSNVSLDELQENLRCGDVVSDQFRYSILSRAAEADILPFCQKHALATLTYMSLEQGLLTGKVGMDRVFSESEFRSDTNWNPWFKLANRPRILDLLAGWKDLTDRYRCTLAQLVVAWTAAQPGVTHVLCGARRADQIIETAAAGDIELAPEVSDRMRKDVEALGEPA
ncbi:MAG: aldo/keto reductase [Phycisphaerae bacterium]|nr:aldo/keto reductase [Phycisphaerae bacterium]